jgi:hypothetical protein
MTLQAGQAMDFTRAAALTKQVYADKLEQMTPDSDKLSKEIDFVAAEKMPGNKYNQPVKMTRSMGFTFSNTGGVFDLNMGLAPLDLNAEIQGSQMVVREFMSYDILERALKGDSGRGGATRAFVSATQDTMVNLQKSASYMREVMLLYGGGTGAAVAIGTVTSVTGSAGTSLVATLDKKDWATAIWAGAENGEFDIFQGTTATKRNAAGLASDRTNVYVLKKVNPLLYQLTFESLAANVSAVAPLDTIFFAGQRGQDLLGFQAAATVQTPNLLWNIDPNQYMLWKPQTLNVGGMLGFEKVVQGLSLVAAIGFSGVINLHVSCQGWQDLCNDQAALVRHAGERAGGKVSFGYESIEFWSQTGLLRIKPNIYVKNGHAFGIPEGEFVRVGSTDWTFNMPGYGKMMRELENKAGVELREYTDQALFGKHPGYLVYFHNISNSV